MEIKSLLTQPLFRSSIPLLIGTGYHLLKALFSHCFLSESTHTLNDGKHNLRDHVQDNGAIPEGLALLNHVSFGVYTNFSAFLLVMLLIDVSFKIAQQGVKGFWKEAKSSIKSSRSRTQNDSVSTMSFEKEPIRLFNILSENQIIRILSYVLIFIVLQITGFCLSLTQGASHPHVVIGNSHEMEKISKMMNIDKEEDDFSRIPRFLEEQDQAIQDVTSASSVSTSFLSSDKFSLSMGTVLGSLNLEVNDIVLSKDRRFAFVTLGAYGTLNIIDTSDLKAPTIKSSLNLQALPSNYRVKSLALSSDEKTLYATSSRYLEIIDITNLDSPKLISFTQSEILNGNEIVDNVKLSRPSLIIDEKREILYIGGLGLHVYDISNPKNPILLKALKSARDKDYHFSRNELCLSRDGQTLFVANGTLDVFDTSNSKDIKLLYSLQKESSARSILLSEDGKTAFLVGIDSSQEIIFEEMDISNPKDSVLIRKMTRLGYKSSECPRFLGVYPSKTKFFILTDSNSLLIFDSVKQRATMNEKDFIEKTSAMHFLPDGKTLITASNSQFMTIELLFNYPNSEIFSQTLDNLKANFSLPTSVSNFELSKDEQFLFVLRLKEEQYYQKSHIFEIWDLQNINEPRVLDSFNCGEGIYKMYLTNNSNTIYLLSEYSLLEADVSNKSSINMKRSYHEQDGYLSSFVISPDEKTCFVLRSRNSRREIMFFDLSNFEEIVTLDKKLAGREVRFLPKDNKTLIVIAEEIFIYDISDLRSPTQIASFAFLMNEPTPYINSVVLSEDTKTLFLETFNHNGFRKLRIYNISVRATPQLITEKYLSRFEVVKNFESNRKTQFSLSPDQKTGFVPQKDSLIKLNLTDLKQPKVVGIIPLPYIAPSETEKFIASSDGHTIYTAFKDQIRVLNTNVKYTLYVKKEQFLLGEKYADKVVMLNLTGDSDYNLVNTNSYKIIKLSLMDIKIAPNQVSVDVTTSPLPSWMTFDSERDILSIEAKKQHDIGTYTLHSAFSLKVPIGVFDGKIGTAEKPVISEDLIAWLISLDYLDSELFLTARFKSIDTFYLPFQFSGYKKQIYNILKEFHIETCTLFEILPSLELSKNLKVSTFSTNEIKVEIKLEGGGSEVKFLNIPYGGLVPVVKENKAKVILEGTISEINTALGSIVVNYENKTSCDANVVVNDGFNPPISMELVNISRYFRANTAPKLNHNTEKTLQEQIDGADIQTGVYFTFSLSNDIFEDDYAENLSYELEMEKAGTGFPSWLILNGLTLKGTPPEEFLGRDLDLVLVAKNEFKESKVPFKLHIKISVAFWLKLLLKYSPYILTFVGLFVSANKIFNVLAKRQYKHPKEYHIGVGEEISPEVIQPILFIEEELKQSEAILKLIKKTWKDFIDPETGRLDREKIKEEIKEVIEGMPFNERENITRYPSQIIDQIIINKFVSTHLDSDKQTKILFEDLKLKSLEVVERDPSFGFAINKNKLNQLLMPIDESKSSNDDNLEEGLIPGGVNLNLLEDAILAFAFEKHSIDISPVDVDIEVKQQVQSRFLFKFLKLNLRSINFNDKNKIDYGINYRIIDDKLLFYGITQSYFQCKTLAVQIKNVRHKIIKEIWIHGSSNDFQKDYLYQERRSQDQGQDYEVF